MLDVFRGWNSSGYNQHHCADGKEETEDGSKIRGEGRLQVFLFLRQCSLAVSLYTTWACQGRLLLDVERWR